MWDDGGRMVADLVDSFARTRRMVPAVDLCLVAAAVVAVVALAVLLAGHPARAAQVLAAAAAGELLVLLAARRLAAPGRRRSRAARLAALALIRAVVVGLVGFAALSVTALAADWPAPLARFLQLGGPAPWSAPR